MVEIHHPCGLTKGASICNALNRQFKAQGVLDRYTVCIIIKLKYKKFQRVRFRERLRSAALLCFIIELKKNSPTMSVTIAGRVIAKWRVSVSVSRYRLMPVASVTLKNVAFACSESD